MFGNGAYGALGIGDEKTVMSTDAAEIKYFTENNIQIKDAALGEHHSVFLSTEGDVYTCGFGGVRSFLSYFKSNKVCALGMKVTNHLGFPKRVTFFERNNIKVKQITAGRYHTVALAESGDVYICGRGVYGTLGTGSLSPHITPVLINDLQNARLHDKGYEIEKIDAADYYTIALTKNGTVLAWGENNNGQLGVGVGTGLDLIESETYPTPVKFGDDDKRIVDIAAGERTMMAVDEQGTLYKSGMRLYYTPNVIKIPADYGVGKPKKVFCGARHYAALYGI